jgi:hypothetical protein
MLTVASSLVPCPVEYEPAAILSVGDADIPRKQFVSVNYILS